MVVCLERKWRQVRRQAAGDVCSVALNKRVKWWTLFLLPLLHSTNRVLGMVRRLLYELYAPPHHCFARTGRLRIEHGDGPESVRTRFQHRLRGADSHAGLPNPGKADAG